MSHVSEDEVEQALSQPDEDRPGREGSRVAIGSKRNGKRNVKDWGHEGLGSHM